MDLYSVRKKLNMGVPLSDLELRVTYYSRVSTQHLEQKSSLRNQVEHFERFIKENFNWTYVEGYVDEGISGTTDYKRDNFMKMIDDAKRGKFDLIVTKEISRFSRNTLDSIKYTRELLTYGVAVLFVNDNINTALPDSELRLTIMASMAQDEIRRLSERVKFGMNESIARGNILGNDMLYGYKKDKNTGNLVIVESEAKLVREMYHLYAVAEYSLRKIANVFNVQGIKTCQGKNWCTSTISRMIRNPKYKGYYVGKKSEIVDYMLKTVKIFDEHEWVMYEDHERIPPIVSDDLWYRANIRLKSRKKRFGDKDSKIIYKNRYLFSAKIYCADHHTLFHRRMNKCYRDEISWICSEYERKGKKVCNTPILRECELYDIFDDIINFLGIHLDCVYDILGDLYRTHEEYFNIEEEMRKLSLLKEKFYLKKDKILELNIEGNISNLEYGIRNQQYNDEIYRIEKKIGLLKDKNVHYHAMKTDNMTIRDFVNEKGSEIELRDKLISLLLKKMIVTKRDGNRENVKLSMFFNISSNFFRSKVKEVSDGNLNNFFSKEYEFFRGYNKKATRRYVMHYKVYCYSVME